MSSFVKEFKKYQKQERLLTGALVLVSVLAPISFTLMLNQKIQWPLCSAVGFVLGVVALWLHALRSNISEKLVRKYEKLEVGDVLCRKVTPTNPGRFVVTNRAYNHLFLKCMYTGETVQVSKDRVREDFDIAN
ncbi:hypothetical protein AZI87_12120 [Bdellovibrio bacteriovorus]|uniref:Uncharacterized protein n=1 Tax=Bdellovibrio bacteriovorus TaxID=959 RepID=A0A162G8R5_BDEBC|nr:hypothetical protein [Bdellovibrio bacteriovorus]KYG65295.1 hypothetical protein AZI87_12120 [Bdellovibrio bacteriovorus]